MTKDEARKELLETLEEYCHDKGYGLQTFAGLSALVYTLYPLQKHMTNADKIRGMNDEQLADFLDRLIESPCHFCRYSDGNSCDGSCDDATIDWLKQEANIE
jgi:hypothetical protein